MDSNETWDLVPLPTGKKAISCGWVYKTKRHADGSVERLKARLVAKGYSQRPGFDFTEVFAPTCRQPTIRMFLAIAAVEDLELRTVDISSAFLNGNLEEDIYMKQTPGFETHPGLVCKLKKSLYGLKQGARQWNKKLHSVLTSLGFKRLHSDHSVYIYVKGDTRILLPVWVDDITAVSKSKEFLD